MLWHGKNFRGFLNKASQVLFNKTGTTLNSTNVQDAICEIDSNLSENNLDNSISITDTDSNNPYVTPSNGWLMVYADDSSTMDVKIKSASNSAFFTCKASHGNVNAVYVKKGMKLYAYAHTGGAYGAEFYPLT